MEKNLDEENFKNSTNFNKIIQSFKKVMFSDRDYILKATKAFVSFVRSYKEHKLASIFPFENFDVEQVARSFFLVKIPVLRELSKKKFNYLIGTEEELEKLEKVDFINKSQKKAVEEKFERNKILKEKLIKKRQFLRKKADKEKNKKKIRSKAERNRAKLRQMENLDMEMKIERKLEKKLKSGKITQEEYDKNMDKLDKKYESGLKI